MFLRYFEIDGRGSPNALLYEDTVAEVVRDIGRQRVGALVLDEVERPRFGVRIRPADSLRASVANEGGQAVTTCIDGDPSRCYKRYLPLSGPPIQYLPGAWTSRKPGARLIRTDPFFRPDEALVHELFHQARVMQGKAWMIPVEGDKYDNTEDFFAITVTNVYISAKGGNDRLRDGHGPEWELLRMSSQEFWVKYDKRISGLIEQMPTFTKLLAKVRCEFNPFRDEFEFREGLKTATCPPGGSCR